MIVFDKRICYVNNIIGFIDNNKRRIFVDSSTKKGYKLLVPDSLAVDSLLSIFNATFLDINIPEYGIVNGEW